MSACPDHLFPVRHFSPAAAVLVERWLETRKPDIVLIEGPADATDQLIHLAHELTKPPVALLAFTNERPVKSLVFPFAVYSPEWVALRWALDHKKTVRLMDLPAMTFLALHEIATDEEADDDEETGHDGDRDAPLSVDVHVDVASPTPRDHTQAYLDDPAEAIAQIAGDPDHDAWWERTFENLDQVEAYRQAAYAFGEGLRAATTDHDGDLTALREAHMRREIVEARISAKKPPTIAVICGAYHAPALAGTLPPMSDADHGKLPRSAGTITLMPFSYGRLARQHGYGAGNQAPRYFEQRYYLALASQERTAAAHHLTEVARHLRLDGHLRSSAEVIEAVRLADGLAQMRGATAPVLADLRDAAITCLGQGEALVLAKAFHATEVGSAVGTLPPGVSRTALQDDFHHQIKALRLERFLADQDQALELDLREDRRAKTVAAAFLDRSRSTFLHRLAVLDIGFASTARRSQDGTSKEAWKLRWTPECEIHLAERSLLADAIDHGAAFALMERLGAAEDVGAATGVLLLAADCALSDALEFALRRVQDLATEESAFAAAAKGIHDLAQVIRYGTVREVDPAPLRPILGQLYLRATLLLYGATVCDDAAAQAIRHAIDRIHEVAFLGDEVDPEPWITAVERVAMSDDRHPFLSGYATALLIERSHIDDEDLDREVARRLSPGSDASVGVAWFEGLVQRNRAALFLRRALWSCLAGYVDELDDDAFRRALLYLRRAFSTFSQGEIRRVVEILKELWQEQNVPSAQDLASAIEQPIAAEDLAQAADDLEGLDLL